MKNEATQLNAETNNNQGDAAMETKVAIETAETTTPHTGEEVATEPTVVKMAELMLKPHKLAQFFPPMPEKEIDNLVADILDHGLKYPIVTHDGCILDGRARLAACKRAGVEPVLVKLPENEDPLDYLVSVSLRRKHFSDDQRIMISAGISMELAKRSKVLRAKTASNARHHGKKGDASGTTAIPKKEPKARANETAAKLFNVSPAKVKLATRLIKESPAAALAVKNGTTSFKKANREVFAAAKVAKIEEAAAAFMAENTGDFDKACQLYHTDFRNLSAIRPDLRENVDWIITDIPYEFKDLHLVPELGKVAAEILKPGGHLVIMTGSAALPTVINGILTTPELGWRWMIASVMKGGPVATMRGIYNANQSFKSILVFRKIGSDVPPSIIKKDVIDAGEMTDLKEIHPHTQSIGNFVNIMDTLDVRPNSLVVDPFCGLFTTGLAALRMNCKFVGCEIEKKYVEFGNKRLMAEWSALHPKPLVVAEALKEAA